MTDMSPVPRAVDFEDIEALRDLLDAGADIQEEHGGLTLVQRAVDVEIDSHNQVLGTLGYAQSPAGSSSDSSADRGMPAIMVECPGLVHPHPATPAFGPPRSQLTRD